MPTSAYTNTAVYVHAVGMGLSLYFYKINSSHANPVNVHLTCLPQLITNAVEKYPCMYIYYTCGCVVLVLVSTYAAKMLCRVVVN